MILICGVFSALPSLSAAEQQNVFSHGSGPIEVIIFADYYCPPCQKVEPYLETVLPKLVTKGVRVSFVDMPYSRKAPMFARYFLYASNAAENLETVLHVRSLLVDVAKVDAVESDKEMIQVFKDKNVDLKFFDIRPVLSRWGDIIREYNVRSTPTCIVLKPGQAAQRYVGGQEIPEGLDQLLQELAGRSGDTGSSE